MKKLFYILVLLSCVSCERAFLGEDVENSPQKNFALFWEDFDAHYGLFVARGWNWDSIYQVYEPQVTAETTDAELWEIFREMTAYLDDSHTFIYDPAGQQFFASGSEMDEQVFSEFSLDLLKKSYLENFVPLELTEAEGEQYGYAKLKGKDIGYIYLSDMEANNKDYIDDVLKILGEHKAMIIDIRNNTGGDDEVGRQLAGRFAESRELAFTVETRNGPLHTDFTDKQSQYLEPLGPEQFRKPILILTDRITVSAAEVFLMYMHTIPDVTLVGDTTAGDFSDVSMRRFLPNGWQYQYSIMQYLEPDGTSLDGRGHVPDVQIRNSSANIQAGTDVVVERAIGYLFETYGIE
ncbi:MAG: S41 family peptidase [Bacteroidota bacterium]